MKYDQHLMDNWYDKTADAYAKVDADPFVKGTMQEMLGVRLQGKSVMDFFKGAQVLDLCCGTGRLFLYLKSSKYILGVDASKGMLKHAAERLKKYKLKGRVVEADITKFVTKEKFDVVICLGTLGEYVPLSQELANRIFSFLAPGGVFVCTIIPLKSRWLMLTIKRILQVFWNLVKVLPLPVSWKHRFYNAAFIAHFAHSAGYVTNVLQEAGFKSIHHEVVLKGHFAHHEFIAKK